MWDVFFDFGDRGLEMHAHNMYQMCSIGANSSQFHRFEFEEYDFLCERQRIYVQIANFDSGAKCARITDPGGFLGVRKSASFLPPGCEFYVFNFKK